jgi:hypothetical protein
MERFANSRTLRPAGACTCRERHNADLSPSQDRQPLPLERGVAQADRIGHVSIEYVRYLGVCAQAVLSQTDPTFSEIGSDPFVLSAVESVGLQEVFKGRSCSAPRSVLR